MARPRVDSMMSEAGQAFRYQNLSRESDEIRLFKIYQDGPRDTIYGSMEVFEINSCPPYRALSYEWGKDDPVHTIYINDGARKVRLNLLAFLWCYRRAMDFQCDDQTPYIWIDHICIHQENTSERNHQVQLMSKIFKRAFEVIAWLGLDFHQHTFLTKRGPTYLQLPPRKQCISVIGPKIFCSSFWQRLWIQQEMILAKEVVFLIDKSLRSASHVHENYQHELWPKNSKWLIESQPVLRATMSKAIERPRHYSLLDAIRHFSDKRCTQSKDRVFGILGMVYSVQRDHIEVDYNMTKEELFRCTIRAVLSIEGYTGDWEEERITATLVDLGQHMGFNYYDAYDIYQETLMAQSSEVLFATPFS